MARYKKTPSSGADELIGKVDFKLEEGKILFPKPNSKQTRCVTAYCKVKMRKFNVGRIRLHVDLPRRLLWAAGICYGFPASFKFLDNGDIAFSWLPVIGSVSNTEVFIRGKIIIPDPPDNYLVYGEGPIVFDYQVSRGLVVIRPTQPEADTPDGWYRALPKLPNEEQIKPSVPTYPWLFLPQSLPCPIQDLVAMGKILSRYLVDSCDRDTILSFVHYLDTKMPPLGATIRASLYHNNNLKIPKFVQSSSKEKYYDIHELTRTVPSITGEESDVWIPCLWEADGTFEGTKRIEDNPNLFMFQPDKCKEE